MADQPPPAPPVLNLWQESVALRDQALLVRQVRRRKAIRVVMAMVALVGVLLLLLLWLSPIPQPYFAPVWIDDYQSRQVPLSLEVDHDREALNAAGFFPRRSSRSYQALDRAQLTQELAALSRRSAAETVVVYLAARARVGAQRDEVYVLPADADLDLPAGWLPLTEVLQRVRACRARAKLLVLDIMAPMAGLYDGVLADDVAAAAVNTFAKFEKEHGRDPHLLVLCACSPGQVALASPEMGRTVFNYYLDEGLRGWADGYGGKAKPDRRVTVRELAEFVRARVDRWAWRNRLARQTPLLLPAGPGADIDLIGLKNGVRQQHLGTADEVGYPNWLAAGWKMRQAWLAEQVYRTMPHLFRELEVVLLEADKEWLHRVDPTRVPENRAQQIQGLAARKQLFRFPSPPAAYSLASAEGPDGKRDPEVPALIRVALSKPTPGGAAPAPAPAPAKPEEGKADKGEKDAKPEPPLPSNPADALEKLRTRPHREVAAATFEMVATKAELTPEKLRQLVALLQIQEPRPRYVETLFLERLADLSAAPADAGWPKEVVRRAVDVVRMGERAASMPDVFAWIRTPLEEAAQQRYQGETLLFARGYAGLDEADTNLRRAAAAYEVCLNVAEVVRRAQRTLDDAMAFLPAAAAYVERVPRHERDWVSAARLADELYRLLAGPADAPTPPPTEEVLARADTLRTKTDELQVRLAELRRPFVPAAWASLKDAHTRPDTGPAQLLEIDALLATPFLTAEDRAVLWKAERGLARRLHEQTREVDTAEDAGAQSITPPRFGTESQPQRAEQERAARRARLSIELLRLGGITADAVAVLESRGDPASWFALDPALAGLFRQAGVPRELLARLQENLRQAAGKTDDELWQANTFALGQLLHQWWAHRVPALLERGGDPAVLDRLSRVFAPADVGLVQADTPVTPQTELATRRARSLWTWLADWNRYLARDAQNQGLPAAGAPALYAAAADTYFQAAQANVPEVAVQLAGPGKPFAPGSPPYALTARLLAPKPDPNATLRLFLRDDAWLQVTPQASVKEAPGDSPELPVELTPQTTIPVPLEITVKPGTSRPMPPPRGVLARVTSNGRAYHHLVPVTLQSVAERLEILLSADNAQPNAPVGELRLRPIPDRQNYFLYVRNPGTKPRNVFVQLRVNGQMLPGAETKLTLPPDRATRVTFPAPAAPPPPPVGTPAAAAPAAADRAELPELAGPLQVRVVDADNRDQVIEEKWLPAGVAGPREYVQVTNLRFFPKTATAKNRLNATLTLIKEPACAAELVLPAARIPGLLEVKDGNLRGEILTAGASLNLYAEDLLLDDGADEEGYVYLNVDRCARAFVFRTTFVRRGEPTTPREETEPALRLRAPTFVRTGEPLAVTIESDNAPAGATLELSVGTLRAGVFLPESTRNLPTARHTRIGFRPSSPSGGMQFDAMIRDWSVELDTLKIKGERTLLARLRAAGGEVIRTDTLRVVIDDQAAEKVRLIGVPEKHKKDLPLVVEAAGQLPVSGLKEVNFFVGKPVDNKLPPNTPTIAGTPLDKDRTRWVAKFPLDGSRKGPTEFSVEYKSNVGLSTFATATVELTDADKPEPGKVEGVVREGPRAQAGLTVKLMNEKNEEKASATTDAEGRFTMENVEPGKYTLTTIKPANKRKGKAPVQVESGKTARVEIGLSL